MSVNPDTSEKFKIIFSSYSEVNNLDRYQDGKAERGLQAIAFVILSGVTIFAGSLYILSLLQSNVVLLYLLYILFVIFILLTAIGVIFIIYAIIPRFNIPIKWEGADPKSIFFFMKIAEMNETKWIDYFQNTGAQELVEKAIKDLILETHLIAQKIPKKVKWTSRGFYLFIASAVFLIFMILPLVMNIIY
jgi:hypothetical protein